MFNMSSILFAKINNDTKYGQNVCKGLVLKNLISLQTTDKLQLFLIGSLKYTTKIKSGMIIFPSVTIFMQTCNRIL